MEERTIHETIPFDDETLAEHISKATRELNGHLEEARKKGLVVQISMIAIENVPAIRLDAVYKRLDKPLILRV
jgi:hypothetical protein